MSILGTMDRPEKHGTSYLFCTKLCPIFGANFKAPGIDQDPFDRKAKAVRVLDLTQTSSYNPGMHPERFDVLFEMEATPREREYLKNGKPSCIPDFISRITKYVKLHTPIVSVEPDPLKYNVLVFLHNPRVLHATDYGILVLKSEDETGSYSRTRPSFSDLTRIQ